MVDSQEFEALWPGGVSAIDVVAPAPRGALKGKRKSLSERFDDLDFVNYDAFGPIFGGEEHAVVAALPKRLKQLGVDAVVSGIGC